MKKSIPLLLSAMMLTNTVLMPTTVTGTSIANQNVNTIQERITSDYWMDISEYHGITYFFRDTADYTVTMEYNPATGVLKIYHRDKATDIVTYDVMSLYENNELFSSYMRQGVIDHSELMENIFFQVVDGEIPLNHTLDVNIEVSEIVDIESNLIEAFTVTNPRVIREMSTRGHANRGFASIGGVTQNGVVSRVYQNSQMSTVNTRTIALARGTTISAIGLLIGRPVGIVATLFAIVTEGGSLVLAAQTNAFDHTVNVTYIRQGRVNGAVMLAPSRVLQYNVILGDLSETSTERWDSTDWNFDNITGIAQEAIRLWNR